MICLRSGSTPATPARRRSTSSAARADGPNLAGGERIALNRLIAVQLRRGHELLHALDTEGITEVRVAELTLEATLLLFLHPPARLKRKANHPFEVVIGDRHLGIGKQELG